MSLKFVTLSLALAAAAPAALAAVIAGPNGLVAAAGGPLGARFGPPASYAQPVLPPGSAFAAHGAVAKLGPGGAVAVGPVAQVAGGVETDYDPNPQYSYAYDVQDALTGDSKSQQETRNGDSVQGSYSVVEPDGTRRVVEYTADPVNGFNAVVHREAKSPQVTKVTGPIALAGLAKYATPQQTKAILG